MHDLATALNRAVEEISESWADDGCSDGLDEDGRMLCVFTLVRTTVMEHREDLLDVLAECVEPTLADYLEAETIRGIASLGEWSNGNPGR